MTDLGIIIIAIVVVVAFIPLSLWLKSKGWLTSDNIDTIHKALSITDYIFQKAVHDVETQGKTGIIIKLSQEATMYVESVAKTSDNNVKKQLAVDSIEKVLKMLNIEIDETDRAIITTSVEIAVGKLPKTYSN